MPLQLSEACNEHEKAALHLALFVGAFLAHFLAQGPSVAMQPASACQKSLLLGFVIEESQNLSRDNAIGHHFHTAQAVSILSRNSFVMLASAVAFARGKFLKYNDKNSPRVSTRMILELASMSSFKFLAVQGCIDSSVFTTAS